MTFRLATSADVPTLSAIEEEAFPGDRLTPRRFRHFIRSTTLNYGYMKTKRAFRPTSWCCSIAVPRWRGSIPSRWQLGRGRGLARQLLDC